VNELKEAERQVLLCVCQICSGQGEVLRCSCDSSIICVECFQRIARGKSPYLASSDDEDADEDEAEEEEDETNVFKAVVTAIEGRCESCDELCCENAKTSVKVISVNSESHVQIAHRQQNAVAKSSSVISARRRMYVWIVIFASTDVNVGFRSRCLFSCVLMMYITRILVKKLRPHSPRYSQTSVTILQITLLLPVPAPDRNRASLSPLSKTQRDCQRSRALPRRWGS